MEEKKLRRRAKRGFSLLFALVFALMSVVPVGMTMVSAAGPVELAGWSGDFSLEEGSLPSTIRAKAITMWHPPHNQALLSLRRP